MLDKLDKKELHFNLIDTVVKDAKRIISNSLEIQKEFFNILQKK